MSRIEQPLTREPIEIDGRAMSTGRRARIIARDGYCCRYPNCEVSTGLQVDHIVALALGGKDTDDNLETLCADDGGKYYPAPEPQTGSEWKLAVTEKAAKDLSYHAAERAKEIARTEGRNGWLRALRESLPSA